MESRNLRRPINLLCNGSEHRSLVLFLSGITGNVDQWIWVRELLKDIPATFAFGAPVLPGVVFGEGIPTVAEASNSMADELRAAHDGKILIVSHSGGSFSALGIARELGGAVKAVILVNGGLTSAAQFLDHPVLGFFARPLRCLTFLHLFLLVSAPAPERLKQAMMNHRWLARAIVGKLVSASALESRERRAALVNEAGGPRVLASLWKNRHHWSKFIAYGHEIRTDVVIVVGEEDPVSTQEDANALAALLPQARIRVLKGVSHAAPLEAPDAVASVVREVLRS